mmetsp:Transcript_26582/g.48094  ORF Transcript_26582/g.48094 Transcript_26582/m.48094 type:complete len:142 (-) Transcript_26582:944-1369(-)
MGWTRPKGAAHAHECRLPLHHPWQCALEEAPMASSLGREPLRQWSSHALDDRNILLVLLGLLALLEVLSAMSSAGDFLLMFEGLTAASQEQLGHFGWPPHSVSTPPGLLQGQSECATRWRHLQLRVAREVWSAEQQPNWMT